MVQWVVKVKNDIDVCHMVDICHAAKGYTLQVADAVDSQDVYNSFIANTYAQDFPLI